MNAPQPDSHGAASADDPSRTLAPAIAHAAANSLGIHYESVDKVDVPIADHVETAGEPADVVDQQPPAEGHTSHHPGVPAHDVGPPHDVDQPPHADPDDGQPHDDGAQPDSDKQQSAAQVVEAAGAHHEDASHPGDEYTDATLSLPADAQSQQPPPAPVSALQQPPAPVHIAPSAEASAYGVDAGLGGDARTRRGTERYHASMDQLKHLVAAFDENPCPSVATLNYLSESIDMPMHNLVLWFKNRRARSKKNLRVPGQRRSYVKSGIYSRSRRTGAPPATLKPEHSAVLVPVSMPMQVDDVDHTVDTAHHVSTAQPHDRFDPTAHAYVSSPPGVQPLAVAQPPHDHDPGAISPLPPTKRARISNMSATRDSDACRYWSSTQCLQAFSSFFDKHTGGQHAEQAKAAYTVASHFFLDEMQSGLTVTSCVQPMKASVEILDALIEKRTNQGHPPLSSGSRTILGEFLVQLRSGHAIAYDDCKPYVAANQRVDAEVGDESLENGDCGVVEEATE